MNNLFPYAGSVCLILSSLFGTWNDDLFFEGIECGSDELLEYQLESDPDLRHRHEMLERAYEHHFKHNAESSLRADYEVPIVFHIIHQNGFENLSDGLVIRALEWLNDGFANINYYDQNNGVDTRIQFCLAQRDPNGIVTTGINRIESPQTNLTNTALMKSLSQWDSRRYVNVWIVKHAGGPGGFSTFPSSHGSLTDGIVVVSEKLRTIGSAHSTLIHELGHYFGLHHVFQGGCTNDDCLSDGDRVCDTPPDASTAAPPSCFVPVNSCNTDANSGFTMDVDDLVWNYLDYGNYQCRSGYTQGQADRMAFFIENVRSSLLNTLACVDPCPTPYAAQFAPDKSSIVMGETVNFNNTSTGGNSYEWSVNGNVESTTQNFSHLFDYGSGEYDVLLKVENGNADCVEYHRDTINVICPAEANFRTSKYRTIIGSAIDFTNLSTNAASQSWYVDGVLESNASDFSKTFTSNGKYTVELVVEDATGMCTDAKSVVIRVQCVVAEFELSDDTPEPGDMITLTNLSEGGNTISWTVNGVPQGSANTLNYHFVTPGVYNVCVKVVNGNCEDELCKKIFVFEEQGAECEKTFISALGTSKIETGQQLTLVENNGILLSGNQDDKIGLTLIDETGDLVWNRVFNPYPEAETVSGLHYESPGVVVGFGFSSQNAQSTRYPFAFKYDYANNNLLWFRDLRFVGNQQSSISGCIADPNSDDYFIHGQIQGGPAFGCNGLIMRINGTTGDLMWQKHYDLGSCETFTGGDIHGDFLYMVGRNNNAGGGTSQMRSAINKFDLDGNQIWSRLYIRPTDVAARMYGTDLLFDQNSILVSNQGDMNGTSATDNEIYLYKTDLDGDIDWCKSYDIAGASTERVRRIFQTTNGYIMAGNYINTAGDQNIFLLEVDPQGELLSTKGFGKAGSSSSIFSLEFFNGNIHILGGTDHIGSGAQDILLLKLNSAGEVIDAECDFDVPLTVEVLNIRNPYDGLHPLTEAGFTATFNNRPNTLEAEAITKTDLCLEPCLVDTCYNGALKDSVPDAMLLTIEVFCNGSGLSLILEVCNEEGIVLPDSCPITIYDDDPLTGTPNVIDVIYMSGSLDSGECQIIDYNLFVNDVESIYIIVNDQGISSMPIDLAEFYPKTGIQECNYINNIGFLEIPKVDLPLELGPDLKICPDQVVDLDAGAGFASYLWSTLETEQMITVWQPGLYTVVVVDSCGQMQTDSINIEPEQETTITIDTLIVMGDTIEINGERYSDPGQYTQKLLSQVTCDTILLINVLVQQGAVHYDMEACLATSSNGMNMDYSEFVAEYPEVLSCATINADFLRRENPAVNKHSCTPGANGTVAMCVEALNDCTYAAGDEKSIVFEIEINPDQDTAVAITGLNFYEKAPEMYDWISGPSGPNNYPTRYGLRVLKDGVQIFEESDIPTTTDWTQEVFSFRGNGDFATENRAVYRFELLGYCLVGNGATVAAWDLDEVSVFASCVSSASIGNAVGGKVVTRAGEDFPHGDVFISNSPAFQSQRWVQTNEEGFYAFQSLPSNTSYMLRATSDHDVMNGITTKDLILIMRHLLGQIEFDDPYDLVAADVNRSRSVSMADISELRKLILGKIDHFTNNTSWRIGDFYQELELGNPWVFDDNVRVLLRTDDQLNKHLLSIKVGDVTGDAHLNGSLSNTNRSAPWKWDMRREGDWIVFQSSTQEEIVGLQLTLGLNDRGVEDIQSNVLPISTENLHLQNGMFNLSLDLLAPRQFSKGEEIFRIKTSDLIENISLDKGSLQSEAYDKDLETKSIVLDQGEEVNLSDLTFQVTPNPFSESTVISWNSDENADMQIELFGVDGHLIFSDKRTVEKGQSNYEIRSERLGNYQGVLAAKIRVGQEVNVIKFVVKR